MRSTSLLARGDGDIKVPLEVLFGDWSSVPVLCPESMFGAGVVCVGAGAGVAACGFGGVAVRTDCAREIPINTISEASTANVARLFPTTRRCREHPLQIGK